MRSVMIRAAVLATAMMLVLVAPLGAETRIRMGLTDPAGSQTLPQ